MKKIIMLLTLSCLVVHFTCSKEKSADDNSPQVQSNNNENKTIKKENENNIQDTVKPVALSRGEKDLVEHLKKLPYWKYYYSNNGIDTTINPDDSLERENTLFQTKLLDYTSKNPETISKNFKEFEKEGLIISTSDDGLFRIYSWDTQTGGTMHFYDNIYQYKTSDKVYSIPIKRDTIEGGDPRSWYSRIYTFMNNGKKYYLGIENSEYSTKDLSQSIKFFTIDNNTLNDNVLLVKKGNEKSNALGINYDFFSVEDHPERPLKLILYDENNKTISIPIVNDQQKVTNKYDVYKFTGEYFEPVK